MECGSNKRFMIYGHFIVFFTVVPPVADHADTLHFPTVSLASVHSARGDFNSTLVFNLLL